MRTIDAAVTGRAVGAVVASAAGDALGAGYEFKNPSPDQEIAMIGGGPFAHKWAKGEWTDDTQMALAILDVIAIGWADLSEIGANFLAWSASNPSDIGNQTASVLYSVDDPDDLPAAAAAYLDMNPDGAGNGGLMRTAPVALAALNDRAEVARLAAAIASLTHAHADSAAACVLWSLAIQEAITTGQPDAPFDFEAAVRNGLEYLADDQRDTWDQRIAEAAVGPPGRFNPNGGVVAAFQAALSAIISTPVLEQASDHLRDALIAAVRIGHDTDTVAAIAGGLLGARWGDSAVPDEWKSLLHGDRRKGVEKVGIEELEVLARSAVARATK